MEQIVKIVPPTKIFVVNILEIDLKIHFSSEFAQPYAYRKYATNV